MSLFNIFNVAGSGMAAQSTRLNTVASNLANADSVASTPEGAYRSKEPLFAAIRAGLDGKPAEAGIDPFNELIDRVSGDNRRAVTIQ